MAVNVGKLLGKPLAWMASLGAGTIIGIVTWIFTVWLFQPDPVAAGIIGTLAVKFAGWLVSEYGPKPAARPSIDRGGV